MDQVVAELDDQNEAPLIVRTSRIAVAAGRGVLGLFVTPIGGISGLVSKTGQGILSRGKNTSKSSLYLDSPEEISTKFLKELKNMHILSFIKCETSEAEKCWLVLTREVLLLFEEKSFSQIMNWNVSEFKKSSIFPLY